MRKFFLIGIIAVILIAVPLTVYILTTGKTTTESGAAPSTLLAFSIPTDPAVIGTPLAIPVTVDPTNGGSGTPNQVSFIKVVIQYDGTKLQAANSYFVADQKLSTLEGPTNNCDSNNLCTISATLSTGSDPNNTISSQATIATLNFNPLAATDPNSPTKLTFASGSQALSIASSDKPAENVLAISRLQPGAVIITAATTTGTPTQSQDDTPTQTPGSTAGNASPTGTPLSCSSLSADNTTATNAPFTVLLTATGSSAANITKVSFNFGDGNVQDVTSGSGIGGNSASVQTSHIYQTVGTFTATAVFTDDTGNTTAPSACSTTITIGSSGTTPTAGAGNTNTPTPTIPPTGPGNTFLGIGAIGAIITTIGLLAAFGI